MPEPHQEYAQHNEQFKANITPVGKSDSVNVAVQANQAIYYQEKYGVAPDPLQ